MITMTLAEACVRYRRAGSTINNAILYHGAPLPLRGHGFARVLPVRAFDQWVTVNRPWWLTEED